MNNAHQPLDNPPTSLLARQTNGQVIRWPIFYELILWLTTGGKESAFRRYAMQLTDLQPGEAVLDVGCGTGSMAILARELVGETGRVSGFEPSPEMISFARRKAARRKLSVDFRTGVIEHIDYPAGSFDVLFCLIVMHHMPDETKLLGIKEMARVLKPGGRLLVVDSNLQLLPPFEQHGFVALRTGPMPIVRGYDFTLWQRTGPSTPEQR